jgi:hypothetical protein
VEHCLLVYFWDSMVVVTFIISYFFVYDTSIKTIECTVSGCSDSYRKSKPMCKVSNTLIITYFKLALFRKRDSTSSAGQYINELALFFICSEVWRCIASEFVYKLDCCPYNPSKIF